MKYEPTKIYRFNVLRKKLRTILSDNDNIDKANFYGVKVFDVKKHKPTKYEYGILVAGIDTNGLKEIKRFFSCDEINFLFEQQNRRIRIEKDI